MKVPVFIKTCLRDAELVGALVRAAHHNWRGDFKFHILVDRNEFEHVKLIVDPPSYAEIYVAEDLFPEATHIIDGYHRQQWYKIQAPSWLGKHLQMDSDMIPCMFLDIEEFFAECEWDYSKPDPGEAFHYKRKLNELGFTYDFSFMCATGWVIFPEVSGALLKRVPNLLDHYVTTSAMWPAELIRVKPIVDAWEVAKTNDVDLRLEDFAPGLELLSITEYNLLGETAFTDPELHKLYKWVDVSKTARNLLHRASYNFNGRVYDRAERRSTNYVRIREALKNGWSPFAPPKHKEDPQRFMRHLKNLAESE